MPLLRFLVLLETLACLGAAVYTSLSLWQVFPDHYPVLRAIGLALWLLPALMLVLQLMRYRLPVWLSVMSARVGTTWFSWLLYMVMFCLLCDLVTLLFPTTRTFFTANLFAAGVCLLIVGSIFLLGHLIYLRKVRRVYDLTINRPLSRPLRIVMLSDLHLGPIIGRGELATWVDLINEEDPDLVLLVGDVVDFDVRPLMQSQAYLELRRLKSRLGVFAVPGNHEYFAGVDGVHDFLSLSNVLLLRDSVALVGGELYLVGRDDAVNPKRRDLGSLLAPLKQDPGLRRPIILLDHQPLKLGETQREGVDVQFSGHTHQGQIFPVNFFVRMFFECAHGHMALGSTHLYVSSGIGCWGARFRLGSRSEYVVLNLSGTSCPI